MAVVVVTEVAAVVSCATVCVNLAILLWSRRLSRPAAEDPEALARNLPAPPDLDAARVAGVAVAVREPRPRPTRAERDAEFVAALRAGVQGPLVGWVAAAEAWTDRVWSVPGPVPHPPVPSNAPEWTWVTDLYMSVSDPLLAAFRGAVDALRAVGPVRAESDRALVALRGLLEEVRRLAEESRPRVPTVGQA